MSDDAAPEESGRKLRWGPIRQAIRDLWQDYHWPVKLTRQAARFVPESELRERFYRE